MPRLGNPRNVPATPIGSGGTGAIDAAGARNNLGLGSIATQPANNVNITGGNITVSSVTSSVVNCPVLSSTVSAFVDTGVVSNNNRAEVNASVSCRASGNYTQVNASVDCTASVSGSQVNAAWLSSTNASFSQVNASANCQANAINSQVDASNNCRNSGQNSKIESSQHVLNSSNFVSCGGWGFFPPSASNKKWELNSSAGTLRLTGNVTTGASFSDYAEFFKNQEGEEIPLGTIVTLEKDGCRVADDGDRILGVVSATGGIVLGDTPFAWQGKYLHGEFGEPIYEKIPDPSWIPTEGQSEQDRPLIVVPKQNPNWNPKAEQIPRSQRPKEWTCVGILGQVFVRIGFYANSMDYLMPIGGVGYRSIEPTRLQVMRVTKTYNPALGYGIAKCLLL